MLVPARRWSTLLWFTLVAPSIPPVVTKWSPNWLSQWQRLVAGIKYWRRTRGEGANHGEGEDEKGDAAGMNPLPWNPCGSAAARSNIPWRAAGGSGFAAAPCRGMSRSTRIIPKLRGQWWFVHDSVINGGCEATPTILVTSRGGVLSLDSYHNTSLSRRCSDQSMGQTMFSIMHQRCNSGATVALILMHQLFVGNKEDMALGARTIERA
jgi:hypothetical protein